jgi:long-chain fatty acid transport protein
VSPPRRKVHRRRRAAIRALRAADAPLILAILGVTSSRDARAAGFAAAHFGGEHGSVVTTNPTALYYNPAGIGFSDGTRLFLGGDLAMRSATWTHALSKTDPADPPGGEGANAGEAHLFNVFGGPALGATTRFGPLAIGAGVFVPFGGRASWATNDKFVGSQYPPAAAGVQRWHLVDGALTFIYGSVGAAYRLGPLSLGAVANAVFSSVSIDQAKNPTGLGDPDTAREGRASLDVGGTNGSFGVGLMLEAIPDRLWLGASYQSQPGVGPQTLGGTLAIRSPTVNTDSKVDFTEALPDILRAGARLRPSEGVELRLYGDFTRWSVNRTQCVAVQGYACAVLPDGSDASGGTLANYRRYWNDTFGIHAGGSYWVRPEVEVFAGAAFETAATPDTTLEPGLADADNVTGAAGARVLLGGWIYVAASYTHIQFLDRDNTGLSALSNAQVPTKQQDGGGKYTQWIGVFDLNVEKTF